MSSVIVLEETTTNPLQLIGKCSGLCYGSDISNVDKNYKRGLECLKNNHGRTLEFPQVYLLLKGYSARCIRELYTHIGGMPTRLQASTRYINYSKGEGFKYVIPHTIAKDEEACNKYKALMENINDNISAFIKEYNIPVEDASMALPLSMETEVVIRTNLRQLIDMSHQRKCTRAYWEFRELMSDIEKALSNYSDGWKYIIESEFKPKCEVYGYCTEKKSCGRRPKKNI